eukprot:scaffold5.g890.t1
MLLQLQCLLSGAAGESAVSAAQAAHLLEQCSAQLVALSVRQQQSEERRAAVAHALEHAACPPGFRFTNPPGLDAAAIVRQSEPFKQLLGQPLPSRRLQLPAAPRADSAGAGVGPGAPAGSGSTHVLAEHTNALPPARRSGFAIPVGKGSGRAATAAPGAAWVQEGQQPHGAPASVPAMQLRQPPGALAQHPPPARPQGQDSRWAPAKLARGAGDDHVHAGRQRQALAGDGEPISLYSDGEDGEGEDGGAAAAEAAANSRVPGFQTAKAKLVTELRKAGQPYAAAALQQQGPPPRQGLQRPQGPPRPAGLRRTQQAAAPAGPGGKFVPPFVRKALDAMTGGGGGGGEDGELPFSERVMSILKLDPAEPLPEELARLDPQLVEAVCNDVLEAGEELVWDDIAGQDAAKALIQEVVVWPMLNPELFTGARAPPKGILMFGPPGTGKTMLGKAIASNVGASFFSISASSLTSKWIGEGEKMVRTLFAVAAWVAPSVIFIDEIDSLLSARKADGEHESSRRLKTEMLMEGCNPANATRRVLLIGATNRPEELDEAARRRMPKQLYIPLPDAAARRCILERKLATVRFELSAADMDKLVAKTEGYSGSDMRDLVQEALQGPVRDAAHTHGQAVTTLKEEALRPVVLRDFRNACKVQHASVQPSEIVRYEEYNSKHGARLAPPTDAGEEDDDDW